MLFSKFFVPVMGMLSVASFAFASPVAAPEPAAVIETRAADAVDVTNVLSLVQGLQTSLNTFLNSNQKLDANTALSQIESTVTGVTSQIKAASLNKADVSAVISVSVNIIVTLVAIFNKFSILSVVLGARIDVFLGAFIKALEVLHPGIGASIGIAIPAINLGIFVSLRLVISVQILGLVNILGGLLGIIGIIL